MTPPRLEHNITGLSQLDGIPREHIVVLGFDLDDAAAVGLLRAALRGVREVSLTELGRTEEGRASLVRRRLLALRALRAHPCQALILAQNDPQLHALAIAVPARRRFVLCDRRLLPLSALGLLPRDVLRGVGRGATLWASRALRGGRWLARIGRAARARLRRGRDQKE